MSTNSVVNEFKTALICGSTQGIGSALVEVLLEADPQISIFATYRKESDLSYLKKLHGQYGSRLVLLELNIDKEEEYQALSDAITQKQAALDLCINCIGMIEGSVSSVEKSIEDFQAESFIESIKVNTVPTAYLAKHLYKNMKESKGAYFISLSAKVGSIQDNHLGGWYSYRGSKAALNMIIKNLSIEWNRFKSKCVVMAVHPGTTETNLTKNFLGSARKKYQVHSPKETAINILELINSAEENNYNGKLVAWDQKIIPW